MFKPTTFFGTVGPAWVFALLPSAIAIVIVSLGSTHIIKPGAAEDGAYSDTLKQLMTLTSAVLAAQVAFVQSSCSGNCWEIFRPTITTEIASHPTVRMLQGFTIVALVALYSFFLLGFPNSLPQATFRVLAIHRLPCADCASCK